MAKPLVGILMGSDSDLPIMKEAGEALKSFEIPYVIRILSAHRAPKEVAAFAEQASKEGFRVIIAGAGGAAHLAGAVAAHTEIPVIGVPIANGPMQGVDALHATVQMPKGIPVATVAIGNAYNAGLLAVQILASGGAQQDEALKKKFLDFKEEMRKKVLAKKIDPQ